VAPNTMRTIEFPGEEPLDGAALDETLVREMKPPFGAGRLAVGGAVVEFERWSDETTQRDPLMAIITVGVAVLALQVGLQYKLVRLFGDGDRPQWGRPLALSERDASRVRVRIGPDGEGASRPQAGLGAALHGHADGNRLQPPQAELVRPEVQPPRQGRPKPVDRPGKHVAVGEEGTSPLRPVTSEKKEKSTGPQLSREQTIEEAQSALLAADLRKAIDSFSHAARQGPLDYDQLNWLGLAHYLAGEYPDATK